MMQNFRCILQLVFVAMATSVRFVQKQNASLHKCSIAWEVPGRGVAKVSFPVNSCLIQCKVTFSDNNYDNQFQKAFHVEGEGNKCQCLDRGGDQVLRFRGDCEDPKANARCFHDYKVLRTNEYIHEYERETTRVVPHFELYHETTFDYSLCEENACPDGDCVKSEFPSIMHGRSAEEKSVRADIFKRNVESYTLIEDEKAIIDQLNAEDIAEILGKTEDAAGTLQGNEEELEEIPDEADDLYAEVVEEAGESPLTVAMLRKIYKKKLRFTAVSVQHLLTVAGLTEDEEAVDLEGFKRFLRPECP